MKRLITKVLTALALGTFFSVSSIAATPAYHDFAASGDSIIYTTTTDLGKLADWVIPGGTSTAFTAKTNQTVTLNPETDAAYASKTTKDCIYIKQIDSNSKSSWWYVTGVTKVMCYVVAGGSRTITLHAVDESAVDTKNVSNIGSGASSVTLGGLDATKNYIIKTESDNDTYMYAMKFTVATKSPIIKSFTIDGVTGSINQVDKTISIMAPSASFDKTAATPTIGLGGTATSVSPASGASVDFSSPVTYTVSDGTTSVNYTATMTAYVTPTPVITVPANKTQNVKGSAAIADIVYTIANAQGATVTGLPTGVTGSYSDGKFTIAGTAAAETTYPKTYQYIVNATALAGYTGNTVADTATITVIDPNAKNIVYITSDGTAASDLFYNNLATKYNVTLQKAGTAVGTYTDYDLIVLQESVSGSNAEALALKSVDKPILNLKNFVYQSDRWNWGTNDNGAGQQSVNVVISDHPVFSGLSGTSLSLTTSTDTKTIQTVIPTIGYGLADASTSVSGASDGFAIHEVLPAERSVTSKYLLIALYNGTMSKLTNTGITLLNNAVSYLLGSTTYDYSNSAVLNASARTISYAGTAFFDLSKAADTKTYNLELDKGSVVTASNVAVVAKDPHAVVGTVSVTNEGVLPCTATFSITEGKTTVDYTINFTEKTSTVVNNASASTANVFAANGAIVINNAQGAKVSIINFAGASIFNGTIASSSAINVAPGAYIVSVNGKATKVIVK